MGPGWLGLRSLVVILAGAELFTNGVEWIGEGFGLSEGAVGSVLAAVGTALPETLLPLVAILSGHGAGEEIGTGAILGAPFMLTTLAMVVIGVSVIIFARRGRRHSTWSSTRRDASGPGYFLVMYALAMVAGLLHSKPVDYGLAVVLVVGYVYYVRRHFQSSGRSELEEEAESEIKDLYVWGGCAVATGAARVDAGASVPAPFVQVTIALGLHHRRGRAVHLGGRPPGAVASTSPLAFALLVAPVATELPEKFNSVLWVRRARTRSRWGT